MTWFKVDDRLHVHRKTRKALGSHGDKRVDAAPMGLWVLAGSWAGQNANDIGWVPEYELDRWDDNWEALAARLVKAGFWWPEVRDDEPGFGFVNWEDFNPSSGASESGKFGNHERWHVKRGKVSPDCEHCPQEPDIAPDSAPDDPESIGSIAPRIAPDIAPRIGSPIGSHRNTRPDPDPIPTRPEPRESARDDSDNLPALIASPSSTDVDTPPKKKVGRRIPEDWQPARTPGNLKAESEFDGETLSRELLKFRNHFTAKAGAGATRLDWDATWQNWLMKVRDFAPRKQPMTGANLTGNDWDRWMAEAAAKDATNDERNSA